MSVAYAGFRKGRGPRNSENLRITKIRMKELFHPESVPVFLSKIQTKTKKKELHSNLVRFLAQKWVQAKNKDLRLPFVSSNFLPQVYEGGSHCRNFCILFCANYTILATQMGGGHGPNAPSPKYAPDYTIYNTIK